MKFAAKGDIVFRGINPNASKLVLVGTFEIPKVKRRNRWQLDFDSVADELREYIKTENIEKNRSLHDIALSDMNVYRPQLKNALDRLKIPYENHHGMRISNTEKQRIKTEAISDAILGISMRTTSERLGVGVRTIRYIQDANKNTINQYKQQAAEAFRNDQTPS